MKYLMGAWVNTGPTAMWKYNEGDPLMKVPGLYSFDANTVEEALEKMWVVGNREGHDSIGRTWPSNVRSMCVGDIVIVGGHGRWVCASMGWTKLS